MNSKQVVNQFITLDNVRANIESGSYEFRGGKSGFIHWCWDVAANKRVFAEGKIEGAFLQNKDLLDEADKEMIVNRKPKEK